jgi:hypothetical protein
MPSSISLLAYGDGKIDLKLSTGRKILLEKLKIAIDDLQPILNGLNQMSHEFPTKNH